MIRICPGWPEVNAHPPIVLSRTDDGNEQPSHGVCDACYRAYLVKIEADERQAAERSAHA